MTSKKENSHQQHAQKIQGTMAMYTAAYNNRGLAKYRLGQSESDCGNSQEAESHYQTAIADMDNAIQLNPKHVKAHRNRGYVKEKLGQQEGAEADFEKAKALDSAA